MPDEGGAGILARGVSFVVEAATENWGTKIMAFLLALVVFIATRGELTRSFPIPLRVISDPDRVLLTALPETVEVRVRGPWVNVNRMSATELGAASLDLREVRPGPMELDPATIVMPEGVVLDALDYDPVDLRFEALVERALKIVPVLVGEVDPDHELASTRVEPDSWMVRAPVSQFEGVNQLSTGSVDIEALATSVEREVELEPPDAQLSFLGVGEGELPTVRVLVEVEAVLGERELELETAAVLHEALPDIAKAELPSSERVIVRGPRKLLRTLDAFDSPLRAVVDLDEDAAGSRDASAPVPVTVRFEWSAQVPRATAEQLSFAPAFVRLRLSPRDAESPD